MSSVRTSFEKLYTIVTDIFYLLLYPFNTDVVYLDQQTGASHAFHWSNHFLLLTIILGSILVGLLCVSSLIKINNLQNSLILRSLTFSPNWMLWKLVLIHQNFVRFHLGFHEILFLFKFCYWSVKASLNKK